VHSNLKPWVRAAVLIALLYAFVGIAFAAPDTHVRFWRLAAWVVSGVAYAGHVAYEHFRLRHTPRSAAIHLATAAALGAWGLAIGANINSLSNATSAQTQRLLLIALVAWPLIVAIPAFLVSLVITTILGHSPWRAPAQNAEPPG
jgi:Na+/H+ antiporter NhaC